MMRSHQQAAPMAAALARPPLLVHLEKQCGLGGPFLIPFVEFFRRVDQIGAAHVRDAISGAFS
jgi:hypothetical protein